jgi:amino acid efflux transporter
MDDSKKIGVVVATAMSITIVVGAGLLALPGLSFSLAGRAGYIPWVIVAFLMVPLLYIFSYFAANNPSAGGVVGYIREALGERWGSASEIIVLGTFTLGIPAIALIGSAYLQQVISTFNVVQSGLLVITIAYIGGMMGLKLSGALQTAIAALIVLGLTAIAIAFLSLASIRPLDLSATYEMSDYRAIAAAVPVILFAYTGWEMTAFLAEDMKNPKRDMPLSIWFSFIIVGLMYVFIAWTVASFALNNEGWKTAPFIQMAKSSMGDAAGTVVGLIAAMLVVANVVAAFISASRAIFSAGRDGSLPRQIGTLSKRGQPVVAMTVTWGLFSMVVLITEINGFGSEALLQLAGQNFFVLYLLCAIGFIKIQRGNKLNMAIGVFATACVSGMLFLFSGPGILYCSTLAFIGLLLSRRKISS